MKSVIRESTDVLRCFERLTVGKHSLIHTVRETSMKRLLVICTFRIFVIWHSRFLKGLHG